MSATSPTPNAEESALHAANAAGVGVQAIEPLPPEVLKELVSNPNWVQIDGELHDLMLKLPRVSYEIERTTILTWMYQNEGVIAFDDLVTMIEKGELRQRKKNLRQVLRNLQDLSLISVVNFPDPDRGLTMEDSDGVVGRNSMFALLWAGMVWLRRAWMARQKMMGSHNFAYVHRVFVEEEDEGKKNSAAWVENIIIQPDGVAPPPPKVRLAMRSVFDMAQESPLTGES